MSPASGASVFHMSVVLTGERMRVHHAYVAQCKSRNTRAQVQ
jgi:hypothetical protein